VAELRIIFAGGGTGGHLFPAIAIAEEFRKVRPDAKILFVGTKEKIEARVVPQYGFQFQSIWISGVHRKRFFKNVLVPLKVIVAMMQAYSIIKNFRPHVVIGTGGYTAGPVLFTASLMKIPTMIHEQNSYPGVTTRMLSKRVSQVHLTFEESKKYFSRKDNLNVSGNPTRRSLEQVNRADALKYFGFSDERRKTVLVFGGSLGARTINNAMLQCVEQLVQDNVRIIWQTGTDDFERVQKECSAYSQSVKVLPFIDRMDFAYALSDVVVCRAGATTIAELTRLGKAAILIPYPHAAADHQTENAKVLANAGAAHMLSDTEVVQKLSEVLSNILNDEGKLSAMRTASTQLGRPDAAQTIVRHALELIEQ
jgi:UDP-N-acetylglucosamine--N-acetylmuramyl-(pentapeptide) pyrophosphoryl-undecaprenol N-acetylglucosamine transferase